ncbi:TIR domain-containing protein [Corynebacterium sp. NPDC060344]|uniref:TIR domain-containing protein n=1 Tax=Corynebacterium sp. NPDC060344 TaxID=3347101 RepID=UPI00365174B4
MKTLTAKIRRKCFISYHHEDTNEVQDFIQRFDHSRDALIARGIGAGMPGDIINSNDPDYIKRRIRENYLRDTTVTIVLIGKNTWKRRFVDWEIAASLRQTATATPNGLVGITLPSASALPRIIIPPRLGDNVSGRNGYAIWWEHPRDDVSLVNMIEEAYYARTAKSILRNNRRPLQKRNAS